MSSRPSPPRPTGRAHPAAWALAAAVLVLFGCRRKAAGESGAPTLEAVVQERALPRVRVEPAAVQPMVRSFETATNVESVREVQVFPRASGLVVELAAEEGQHVEEGQVLARLDDRDARNALADAELALAEAEAAVPRLELAVREAEARRDNQERAWQQAQRDHERNLAIASDESTPVLISQRDLDQSRLAADTARGDFETAKIALRRAELEQADGELAVSRARLARDRAQLALSFLQIEAPFAGVLADRSIRVGDTVSTQTPAFRLTDPDQLRAIFYRPQRELSLFAAGPGDGAADGGDEPFEIEITATAEALPGHTFGGQIERISPTIDPESGNFRVTVALDPEDRKSPGARLLPGMLIRLTVVTDRHLAALTVPKRAVRRQGEEACVFVLRDGHAVRTRVAEGYSDDERVEVTPLDGGLAPGDEVVVVGNRDLEDGVEVEVARDEPAAGRDADATPGADD